MTSWTVFEAPWDQRLMAITLGVAGLLLGATALLIWVTMTRLPASVMRGVLLGSALIPLAAFVLGALWAPRRYAVGHGRLKIERWAGPIEIPLASIRSVARLEDARLTRAWRVLGSGGFFGYYGRFRNEPMGDFRMYATRGEGYVLVEADDQFVLTPESPDRFIEAIERGRSGGGAPISARAGMR